MRTFILKHPDHPLPTSLLGKLVEARMEEVSTPGYGRRP
jgi:hypothetical protein